MKLFFKQEEKTLYHILNMNLPIFSEIPLCIESKMTKYSHFSLENKYRITRTVLV